MESTEKLHTKILSLSLGDSKMEATLASLYYKSLQDLKFLYATGLTKKDPKHIQFIRHKYQSTFHMLNLSALAVEVNDGKNKIGIEGSEEAIQVSIERVGSLCNDVLAQLREYYPWLDRESNQTI